jgi:cytochrome d ubiquinol oxidase subunit I
MVMAAYLTTALVVGAASAWRVLVAKDSPASRMALRMAVGMIVVAAPLQLLFGHLSGDVMREYQPMKTAAVESYWKTGANQPLVLIALPDRKTQSNHFELKIPGVGNLIQGVGPKVVIQGLDKVPVADQAPVAVVFWSFRLMVGLGMLMIGLGIWGAVLWARSRLFDSRLFLWAAVAMGPAGFAAVVLGWITAEVGRQPWVAYGVLRTRDAVSPVATGAVAASLIIFMVVYAVVFTAGAIYILRLLAQGPDLRPEAPATDLPRAPGSPLAATTDEAKS